jgi:hypothetical protein
MFIVKTCNVVVVNGFWVVFWDQNTWNKFPGSEIQNVNIRTRTEFLKQQQRIYILCTTNRICYYISSKGTQEGIWMKAKGDYQDRVHSDQIVLVKVMRGGWTAWAVANSKQRGNTWVKSTQMRWFLGSQVQEAGLLKQWPKNIQRKS